MLAAFVLMTLAILIQSLVILAHARRLQSIESDTTALDSEFTKFADRFYWVRMPENGEMKPFVMLAEKTDVRNVAEPLHQLIKALGYEWVPGGTTHTSPKLVHVQVPAKLVKVKK